MDKRNDILTFLYRGPLSWCNYSCEYCPFSKTQSDPRELRRDRDALENFVEFLENRGVPEPFSSATIMFIPWGEALVHDYYQTALTRLGELPVVKTLVIQTNLSVTPLWIENTATSKFSFWCTFHPSQTDVASFLNRTHILEQFRVRYCVGIVAREDYYDTAMQLRERLPQHVTCWANPLDDDATLYSPESVRLWSRFDPLFVHTLKRRQTFATLCRCGDSVFTVSGNGDFRRCPFVEEILGNIYSDDFSQIRQQSRKKMCPRETCTCFIGYIHWETPEFRELYAKEPLCRIARSRNGVAGFLTRRDEK